MLSKASHLQRPLPPVGPSASQALAWVGPMARCLQPGTWKVGTWCPGALFPAISRQAQPHLPSHPGRMAP